MNPNHQVMWRPTRPDLTVTFLRSTSPYRCYSESFYEVISRKPIGDAGMRFLDALGLLGIGQVYDVVTTEKIVDKVPPVVVDKRTGEVVECDCGGGPQGEGLVSVPHAAGCAGVPVDYQGRGIYNTHEYEYTRYVVRRVCDSGD